LIEKGVVAVAAAKEFSTLRNITIEDLYQFKQVSRPRISPDGQRVAFVITTIDERKQEYHSSIWIVSTDGGEAKRFTGGASNAHSPNWSPDGNWLGFVTDREGEPVGKVQAEQKKQKKKLNHKSGLFQQMAVKHDNSRLCNMELQILSGRQIANR